MQCRRKMTVGSFRPVAALAGDTDTALGVEFQKGCGQQLRVVADIPVTDGGYRAADQFHPQIRTLGFVIVQWLRTLPGVALQDLRRDGGGVYQAQMEQLRQGMLEKGADMVGVGIALGAPGAWGPARRTGLLPP